MANVSYSKCEEGYFCVFEGGGKSNEGCGVSKQSWSNCIRCRRTPFPLNNWINGQQLCKGVRNEYEHIECTWCM